MAQTVDVEVRRAIEDEIEELRGPLVSNLVKAMEETIQVAHESEIPKFIRSTEGALEPTKQMAKAFSDLADVCEEYAQHLKSLDDNLS